MKIDDQTLLKVNKLPLAGKQHVDAIVKRFVDACRSTGINPAENINRTIIEAIEDWNLNHNRREDKMSVLDMEPDEREEARRDYTQYKSPSPDNQ